MEPVVQVSGLTHLYGDHQALDSLEFSVNRGEVFGLLGPNGAGKTTTVRLLNGMFEPSKGHLSVLGLDPTTAGADVRKQSGVLTETPALYERLTARQNLRFFGVLAGLSDQEIAVRTEELLSAFGLLSRADDRTGSYSKGMKQRLALSRAWLTRPKILFLDEPTAGLDPEAAVQVRELIAEVREKEGTTVLICTHNLAEAQRLCDRLLIMRKGSTLAQGNLTELRSLVSNGLWVEVQFLETFQVNKFHITEEFGVRQINQKDEYSVQVEVNNEANVPQVLSLLIAEGAKIIRVSPQEISLEDVYLQLQNNANGKGEVK